jgi:hypothetical protein
MSCDRSRPWRKRRCIPNCPHLSYRFASDLSWFLSCRSIALHVLRFGLVLLYPLSRWNADAPPYLSLLRPDGESLLLLLYPDGADDVCPSLKYVDLWLALMPRLMADVRETFRMKLRDCHRGCLVQHLAHALAADNDEAAI